MLDRHKSVCTFVSSSHKNTSANFQNVSGVPPAMSTASSTAPNAGSTAKPRSSAERVVVWGIILVLVSVAGYEFYVKSKFEAAEKAVLDKLADAEKDLKSATHLTDKDIPVLLGGKKPDFVGNPGQVSMLNSNYYEAYVWKSLIKNRFVMPPEKPEILNMSALYAGEVPPEQVKYRTPGYDKNIEDKANFFSAYVLYIYYGGLHKGVREVINVARERVPYHDSVRTPPDAAQLKQIHEQNIASAIALQEKSGIKLTDKQKEELDSWKHPRQATDENMRNIPNWDPVTNTYRPMKHDAEAPEVEPKKSAAPVNQPEPGGPAKSAAAPKVDATAAKKVDSEQPVVKPAEKSTEKPAAKTPEQPVDEKAKAPAKADSK